MKTTVVDSCDIFFYRAALFLAVLWEMTHSVTR